MIDYGTPDTVAPGRRIHELCSAISRAMVKKSQAKLGAVGLSAGAAGFIRAVGDRDDMTLSDVAKVLRVETATLSSLAVRLERDGLLVREPSPKDKRAMLLHLTPRARELGQQAEQITQSELSKLTKGVADTDQKRLVELLQNVLKNLDDDTP
ncbi:MarR family winged helix-turn-helix transcriptional regulator [Sulfitobacter sp. 916]|uniref:MarR family winged helix-turn-helix transcriptional regulator n=1 Tax=Sulfitobacter sp. 916 TaxID=3368559 RepID=UPI003745F07C